MSKELINKILEEIGLESIDDNKLSKEEQETSEKREVEQDTRNNENR